MRKLITTKTILMAACLQGPLSTVLIYVITGDILYASLSLICTTIVSLVVARYVLIEPDQAKLTSVATIVTAGFFCASSLVLSQSSIIWQAANRLLQIYFPGLALPDVSGNETIPLTLAIIIVLATVAVAALVLKSGNIPTGALRKATALDHKQLEVIARTLKDHLDSLDQDLRFFDFRSPTINPGLEELSTSSRYVVIRTPLQVASNASNSDFIVVKGDPGSGKSVMLRSLARQLLSKIGYGGKVPLLLNMRDWSLPDDASQAEMVLSLGAWAKAEFGRQTGSRAPAISNDEFDQLYAEGSFIFLFDSFDENASVSNEPHHGTFIGRLSHALVDYVRASGGCVGLVFSREYKSPSAGWISHRTYDVRPFSDKEVRKYINENCTSAKGLIRAIMGERRDLYAMAKTPLLLALLVDFTNTNSGELPDSEFQVFESFVQRRIARALGSLGLPNEMSAEAERSARFLARELSVDHPSFRGTRGPTRLTNASRELGLSILREARLLRRSGAGEGFSHKRFQEYFRVCSMIDGEEAPPSITPNRIDDNRDVLNLYAQICSPKLARKLAKEAHGNLTASFEVYDSTDDVTEYEAVVLCLRFLRNAFRNRASLLDSYRGSIREIVVSLWNRMDPLNQKHAVEQVSLLPPTTATSLVRNSLNGTIGLLRRVALSEARYVSSLQPWLGRCVAAYTTKLEDIDCFVEYTRGNLTAAMTNAAPEDKASIIIDAVLRFALLSMAITTIVVGNPLLSASVILFLVMLYVALNVVHRGFELDVFASMGFNPGLSGLVACNTLTAALIDEVTAAFDPSKQHFWEKPGPALLSVAMIFAAFAMLLNNLLVRRRDGFDDLGQVKPISTALLSLNRSTQSAALSFFRRHWAIMLLVVLAISANFASALGVATNPFRWAMIALYIVWGAIMAASIASGAFSRLRIAIVERIDRPKVLRFTRHFSGKRDEIYGALNNVRTEQSRMRVLIAADAVSSEFASQLREPTNIWPDGRRPTFEPYVNSYLAILDERWWGLG